LVQPLLLFAIPIIALAAVLVWQRRRARLTLAVSEARYRALADASAAGVWNVDNEGRTLYANPAMCRLLEIEGPEELVGHHYHEFYTRESIAQVRSEYEKRLEGLSSTYEVHLVGRRGTRRSAILSGSPIFGPDGKMQSLIGTFIDVTERRRLALVNTATYRISEAVHSVSTLQELFAAIHRIVGELMPASNFYIALHDSDADVLSFPYFVDEEDPPPGPRSPGRGLTEYVLRTGQPLLVTPAVMKDLQGRGEVELAGSDSIDWLGAPLETGGEVFGALVVQSYTEGVRYSEAELDILQFVSVQVAMAIERKRTDEALRESGQRLAQSQAIAHLGSWELDLSDLADVNRNPLWWSDEAYRIFGFEPRSVRITNDVFFSIVHPDDRARIADAVAKSVQGGAPYLIEHRIVRADGTERVVREQSTIMKDEHGRPRRMVGTVLDVTDERRLQDQLRQAQKMEAVGRLAGGMAHDFNNLLTAVLATSDLLAAELPANTPHRDDIDIIRAAAARGADLVKKLLAFSRQQPVVLETVHLEALLTDFIRLARRVVPEDVEVVLQVRAKRAIIRADAAAVEQMLMNLVTNARDAMSSGGRLVLEIDRMKVSAAQVRDWGFGESGEYVTLSVMDNGTGMDRETMRRVFEPFFTTKAVGQGTGLGMAMVYGLVKQHNSYVSVESEPGQGTTVRIFFPAAQAGSKDAQVSGPLTKPGKGETILVVEDDSTLRQSARRVLETSGYTVATASDGQEALNWMQLNLENPPDLIISDVVMPRVSGPSMVSKLRESGRAPKVLFTTGYAAPDVRSRVPDQPGISMLAKPWTIADLLARVREILDAPAGQVSG
jgi:PAS domain S-box-containing protein